MGLFGRGKHEASGSVCSECGRSLLAGELTHRVVDDEGNERIICSLCGKPSVKGVESQVYKGSPPPDTDDTERSDSDRFWRALKEKEAQIAHLEARLARSEAERQEVAAQLALLQTQVEAGGAAAAGGGATAAGADEVIGEHAAAIAAAGADEVAGEHAAAVQQAAASAVDDTPAAELPYEEAPAPEQASEAAPAAEAAVTGEPGEDTAAMPAPGNAGDEAAAQPVTVQSEAAHNATAVTEPDGAPPAEPDEGVSSLTLLQRGVDILNVSPVPRKVADTSADLGVPQVHVGFDGQKATVTFLWSLGWYRFAVDIEGAGTVRLEERGYDERPDLQPNASVRGDGTVQLAPAQISRAAREREAAPPPEEVPADGPRTPRDAAERPPEIVSQSLLGQRTDDEKPSWEQTEARDFHW